MGTTSLKADEVVRQLADNQYNISKTMRKVGYTEQGSHSGANYLTIRKRLERYYNPEQIKADILKAEKDFAKDKDNSNRARMLELRAKIQGLSRDTNLQQVQVNVNDTIDALKTPKPIDVSTSSP